jgi:cellulose synthase/poly-beta-1,6-N-acetylglucosamine synthase-like glycosyltransferase
MTERPRVSVVVPAYNEGEQVITVLDRLFESVRLPCEVLVVVDSPDDTTVPVAEEYSVRSRGSSAWSTRMAEGRPTRSGSGSTPPPRRWPW